MFFKKQKDEYKDINDQMDADRMDDVHALIIETLATVCTDGVRYEDAFVLEDDEIYVYADVLSIHDNVVQIVFQLHHEWLEDAIVEAVAAAGNSVEDALLHACEQFYDHVLHIYLQALHETEQGDIAEGFTEERHFFHVFRSKVSGIGKKEGLDDDYWKLIKDDLLQRLGNKKLYWVKVFASKDAKNAIAEVWINGKEANELSRKLLAYAASWDTVGAMHTEKQHFIFVQDDKSYVKSDFSKEEIQEYSQKATRLFEKCSSKEEHLQIRKQLIKWCEDDSLAYEIFSFLPELYCKYAYPQVEFGEKLFLVRKGEKTRELYQSQVQSYAYIEDVVKQHFEQDTIDENAIHRVLAYSANAKAIQKAIHEGDDPQELLVPGIGYFVNDLYQLR